jgi:hypothetical protein
MFFDDDDTAAIIEVGAGDPITDLLSVRSRNASRR